MNRGGGVAVPFAWITKCKSGMGGGVLNASHAVIYTLYLKMYGYFETQISKYLLFACLWK